MKNTALLIVGGILFATLPLAADTNIVDGYAWTYRISGDTATITGVSPAVGAVTIPSMLGGKPVASIGLLAFSGCNGLTSVTIPYGVTSIGDKAFNSCSGLTWVAIPESVTNIGDEVFDGCSSLTSMTIPDSVTSIGDGAFKGCIGLIETSIGKGVTSIGASAFSGCRGLMSVTIPDSVTSIGNAAFKDCSELMRVTIGESVKSIGASAFSGCSGMMSVTLPDSVTSIGNEAFKGCVGLKSLTVPDSVISIGDKSFSDCIGLTKVTIGRGVTSIGGAAFSGCSGLTSVTIPDSVTSIGASSFSGCSGLTSVVIGKGVTSIGASAFLGCSRLKTVTIPDSVTSVGGSSFCGCSSLKSVMIGKGVTGIGMGAFENCISLTDVTIPDNVVNIGGYAFVYCEGLTSVTIGKGVASIGIGAFADCTRLTQVVFDGNAPLTENFVFDGVASGCTAYVNRASTGWGVSIPGKWNGIKIAYRSSGAKGGGSGAQSGGSPAGGDVSGGSGGDDSVIPGGTVSDTTFARVQKVTGALYNKNNKLVGTVLVKIGKVNSRQGRVGVSASATLLTSGKVKKVTAKAVSVKLDKVNSSLLSRAVLVFKAPIGEMTFKMAADGTLTLNNGTYYMGEAEIGGAVKDGVFMLEDLDLTVSGELQKDLLPYEEPFTTAGGKWKFAKHSVVKWARDRATREYSLFVDASNGKTNGSSLKLVYTANTGIFKGTFKAYVLEKKNGRTKLAKYTVNVTGLVVDGVGTGTATCRNPALSWRVTVTN